LVVFKRSPQKGGEKKKKKIPTKKKKKPPRPPPPPLPKKIHWVVHLTTQVSARKHNTLLWINYEADKSM